jgi:hydroxylamine dehydrogenase
MLGIALAFPAAPGEAATAKVKASKEGQACIGCQEVQPPAFVKEWKLSTHAAKGVDCYTCHKAEKSNPDAMEHNGYTIMILVTPKDCGRCHSKEEKEMTESHHAKAGDILNSADNYPGEVVGGQEALPVRSSITILRRNISSPMCGTSGTPRG